MDARETPAPALQFKRIRIADLSADDRTRWRNICSQKTPPASPLVSPDFAELIARERNDVWCILAHQNAQLVAAMAVHLRPWGFARPVGAPFDDTSGPVVAQGINLNLADMLAGAKIDSYRAGASCAAPQHCMQITGGNASETHGIYLGDKSPAEYLEQQRSLYSKRFKNFRRLSRKLETERGVLEFRWGAPDPERLAMLLSWKRDQFHQTGLLDVTAAKLSAKVLRLAAAARASDTNNLSGFMTELLIDGRLITGHFGIRNATNFHPWIAAYDPVYSDYAPGMQLLHKVTEHMREMDLIYYDLAEGHDHYKKYFAAHALPVQRIEYCAGNLQGRVHAASFRSWNLIGGGRDDGPGARLRRRLDHIAACEPGLGQRMSQFGSALASRR
jgi:CelD/BcsL family acetyltransferase involved in cellulose biosynthesis